jgi:hypothetical protein
MRRLLLEGPAVNTQLDFTNATDIDGNIHHTTERARQLWHEWVSVQINTGHADTYIDQDASAAWVAGKHCIADLPESSLDTYVVGVHSTGTVYVFPASTRDAACAANLDKWMPYLRNIREYGTPEELRDTLVNLGMVFTNPVRGFGRR